MPDIHLEVYFFSKILDSTHRSLTRTSHLEPWSSLSIIFLTSHLEALWCIFYMTVQQCSKCDASPPGWGYSTSSNKYNTLVFLISEFQAFCGKHGFWHLHVSFYQHCCNNACGGWKLYGLDLKKLNVPTQCSKCGASPPGWASCHFLQLVAIMPVWWCFPEFHAFCGEHMFLRMHISLYQPCFNIICGRLRLYKINFRKLYAST